MDIRIIYMLLILSFVLVVAVALIEEYNLKKMMKKLKIEEENSKNLKQILDKYLNNEKDDWLNNKFFIYKEKRWK